MSDLAKLCDALIACSQATLAMIEGEDPSLHDISLRVQERASLFSKISSGHKAPHSASDARLLTQLSRTLQPIDAKILAWMQATQASVASSLRKVQKDIQPNPRSPSEARILIQDA